MIEQGLAGGTERLIFAQERGAQRPLTKRQTADLEKVLRSYTNTAWNQLVLNFVTVNQNNTVTINNNNNSVVAEEVPPDCYIEQAVADQLADDEEVGRNLVICGNDLYAWDPDTGLWTATYSDDVTARLSKAISRIPDVPPKVHSRMKTFAYAATVLKYMKPLVRNEKFASTLDQVPVGFVAFQNGMLDGRTGQLRRFLREDRLTEAGLTPYCFSHQVPEEELKVVEDYLQQVFPVEHERSAFIKLVG